MLPFGQISAIGHSTDVLEGIWPGWSKVGAWVEKALHSNGFCLNVPIKIQELIDAAWLTIDREGKLEFENCWFSVSRHSGIDKN